MGFRINVRAKTRADLVRQSNPGVGDQPEALAWVFYDTQTYIDNVTTFLRFFTAASNDPSITNLETPGSLPDPQFFEIGYFGLDILTNVAEAASVTLGPLNDVHSLVLTSRPRWSFNISNKEIGPFPLSFCHASGGVTGFSSATGTNATPLVGAYANNGIFDGGWCADQAITIPPKVGFNVRIDWPAAVNISGDTDLRFWMAGTLHRRVL